jgi:hypothetical protein
MELGFQMMFQMIALIIPQKPKREGQIVYRHVISMFVPTAGVCGIVIVAQTEGNKGPGNNKK